MPPTILRVDYMPWGRPTRERPAACGQAAVHLSTARTRVIMAGRQSGKSRVAIAEIATWAMSNPKQILWWVAPNYRVKAKPWRDLLDFIPREIVERKNETELFVVLKNGSTIYIKSADAPDSLVSETLNGVVCDEAGQWKEDAWTRGIRPMLNTTNGPIIMVGTPRGRNWFWRLWQRGKSGEDKNVASFHWRSEDSPYIDAEEIRQAKLDLPRDTYRQEYDAEPLDNVLAVFRNIKSCIRGMPAEADGSTVIGADVARKQDWTVLTAMNTRRQVVAIERFQDDWPIQTARTVAMCIRNNFARVIADATGVGDVYVANLREKGLQVEEFVFTNERKQQLIDNLRLAFEQQTVTIPTDEGLLSELEAYEFQRTEQGRYRYSAPEGMNDDRVMSLALALWGQRGLPTEEFMRPMTNYLTPNAPRTVSSNYLTGAR